jgi:hypothetical protein
MHRKNNALWTNKDQMHDKAIDIALLVLRKADRQRTLSYQKGVVLKLRHNSVMPYAS